MDEAEFGLNASGDSEMEILLLTNHHAENTLGDDEGFIDSFSNLKLGNGVVATSSGTNTDFIVVSATCMSFIFTVVNAINCTHSHAHTHLLYTDDDLKGIVLSPPMSPLHPHIFRFSCSAAGFPPN